MSDFEAKKVNKRQNHSLAVRAKEYIKEEKVMRSSMPSIKIENMEAKLTKSKEREGDSDHHSARSVNKLRAIVRGDSLSGAPTLAQVAIQAKLENDARSCSSQSL